jgi:hypothetical protein
MAGDFKINYKINPSGTFNANAFRRSNYDVLSNGLRNKSGFGLSYSREFNTFKELFKTYKKTKKTHTLATDSINPSTSLTPQTIQAQ